MRGQFQGNPDDSLLSMTNQDPAFDNADFEAVKAITDRAGYFGSLGDRHFTVEFPWDAGAATRLLNLEDARESLHVAQRLSKVQLERLAGKTSLLEIRISAHPCTERGSLRERPVRMACTGSVHAPLHFVVNAVTGTVHRLKWECPRCAGGTLPGH
jgi:hypothetical protein